MQAITEDQARNALALITQHGGIKPAARATGLSYRTLHRHYAKAKELKLDTDTPVVDVEPVVRGRIHARPRSEWPVPKRGKVSRYIFTCAQNNTELHTDVWANLVALARHYDARICVSTFTYDKASYGKNSIKRGSEKASDTDDLWYPKELEPHMLDESVVVAPGLVWCGEMNILPTAVRPLSGMEAYTGRASGIFPHVKFAMESIASGKHEGTKFNYTTGTVTQRNYIAKKAGLKAEFHHGYGALLVEVDSDGDWFVRQLNADSDGTIYDLTLCAKDGDVTDGHRAEGVTWGDIHVGSVSRDTMELKWGNGGMLDVLEPKFQFMHDTLDFRSRNHHDRGDFHKLFEKHVTGKDGVVEELRSVAEFLDGASYRHWCTTVVVDSNHDRALLRWLKEADGRYDPKNALFWFSANKRALEAISRSEPDFHLFEWTMQELGVGEVVKFLRPDESFIICRQSGGGIECGMHGHLGVNGARATLRQFALMGRKSNTGHGHAAGIYDGAYRGGITGDLDQGYNAGPSSWSISDIVTYPNGKRVIITSYHGKWRA